MLGGFRQSTDAAQIVALDLSGQVPLPLGSAKPPASCAAVIPLDSSSCTIVDSGPADRPSLPRISGRGLADRAGPG